MASVPRDRPWHSHEEMGKYDSLFPLLPDYVAHYTIGLKRGPRIGISSKEDLHLEKDIRAILISNALEIGVAYAGKRYAKEPTQTRWLGLTERIDKLYDLGRKGFSWHISLSNDVPESYQGLSTQFFYRNLASFDASKRLAELGYLCEVATILRAAVEQFAFYGYLRRLSVDKDVAKIERKQSFHQLKNVIPAAGSLYGLLSKYTHFEFDHHTHFFAHSDDKVLTLQTGPVLRAYATHLIFLTMACVSSYLLKMAVDSDKSNSSITALKSFNEESLRYSDEVCLMLPNDSILAEIDIMLVDITRQDKTTQ